MKSSRNISCAPATLVSRPTDVMTDDSSTMSHRGINDLAGPLGRVNTPLCSTTCSTFRTCTRSGSYPLSLNCLYYHIYDILRITTLAMPCITNTNTIPSSTPTPSPPSFMVGDEDLTEATASINFLTARSIPPSNNSSQDLTWALCLIFVFVGVLCLFCISWCFRDRLLKTVLRICDDEGVVTNTSGTRRWWWRRRQDDSTQVNNTSTTPSEAVNGDHGSASQQASSPVHTLHTGSSTSTLVSDETEGHKEGYSYTTNLKEVTVESMVRAPERVVVRSSG